MELKNIQGMTLDEKKAYLAELIAERDRIASGEQLRKQSGGLQAAAEALMPYDPMSAFDLMDTKANTDIKRDKLLSDGTNKSQLTRLEQLWKDNTRALLEARKTGQDRTIIKQYEDNIARLELQLKDLSPETWGDIVATPTDSERQTRVDNAIAEGKQIVNASPDKNNDGVIDDEASRRATIKALKDKYNISDDDIKPVLDFYEGKISELAKVKTAKTDADQLAYDRNKDRNDAKIQGWKSDVTAWKEIRRKAISAISNFKNHNFGASQTITMKALLGDALSEQERSVMASKGYGSSIFGGLWSKLTNSATPVTEADAEKVIKGLIDYVNSLRGDFKGLENNKYVLDGLGLDKSYMAPISFTSNKNTTGGLKTGENKSEKTKANPLGLNLD